MFVFKMAHASRVPVAIGNCKENWEKKVSRSIVESVSVRRREATMTVMTVPS